jgi:putative NADH-flavin reductase
MQKQKQHKRRRGFTIDELLIVVGFVLFVGGTGLLYISGGNSALYTQLFPRQAQAYAAQQQADAMNNLATQIKIENELTQRQAIQTNNSSNAR